MINRKHILYNRPNRRNTGTISMAETLRQSGHTVQIKIRMNMVCILTYS